MYPRSCISKMKVEMCVLMDLLEKGHTKERPFSNMHARPKMQGEERKKKKNDVTIVDRKERGRKKAANSIVICILWGTIPDSTAWNFKILNKGAKDRLDVTIMVGIWSRITMEVWDLHKLRNIGFTKLICSFIRSPATLHTLADSVPFLA